MGLAFRLFFPGSHRRRLTTCRLCPNTVSMDKPHLLVTNDDGIDSFFLRCLVDGLMDDFRITVAAPMGEQSWIGRAISRHREVHLAEYEDYPCRAYALDGTPSDCVNIALGHLVEDDPVVGVCSGINVGFNACTPIVLSSGTVAGAIEGAGWGLPAAAFSHQVSEDEYESVRKNHGRGSDALEASLRAASSRASRLMREILEQPVERPIVHNLNFPTGTTADTPVERTKPLPIRLLKLFERETAVSFTFKYPEGQVFTLEGAYDMPCLLRGNISHSVFDLNAFAEG